MAKAPQADALKGHLDLLLLAVIESGALHGYAIIEELRRRSDDAFEVPEGTIYPALHRLERAGLLASDWAEAAGRRRKVYRLTSDGRAALDAKRASWAVFASAVRRVIGGSGEAWPSRA